MASAAASTFCRHGQPDGCLKKLLNTRTSSSTATPASTTGVHHR
jgi:hypothetical protein